MNPFRYNFKDFDRKFTQPQSRAHTQNFFNERLSIVGYKLPLRDKICGFKFWPIFSGFILAYNGIVTILSRLIFAFAKSVSIISKVLMVRKGELFRKSPKPQ